MKQLTILFMQFVVFYYGTFAQSCGDIDSSFGINGIVITDITTFYETSKSIAIQSDGKIVVGAVSNAGSNTNFTLIRYDQNGSLDNSFSTNGIVTTDINLNEGINSIAIQSDGKIVAAGYTTTPISKDFTVIRYNQDGSLDNTFSSDGIVITDIAGFPDFGNSIAIQQDGKIVVAGSCNYGTNSNDFAVIRYNPNGTLDNTFSNDGIVTTDIYSSNDFGHSIAIQQDGKIVVAGVSSNEFSIVRYNPNGTLDNTFSLDGIFTTHISNTDNTGNSVILQSDGKILVAGSSFIGNDKISLIRLNTDGSLDTSFSSDGKVTSNDNYFIEEGYSMAIQPDGKIIVAGTVYFDSQNSGFVIERYNVDGTIDSTFSSNGIITTDIGNSYEEGYSMAIQPDGKIIVSGLTTNGSNSSFATARYSCSDVSVKPIDFKNQITVSPNPTSDYLNICINSFITFPLCLNIFDIQGKLIKQMVFKQSESEIDIVDLHQGIYILKISGDKFIQTEKFVKL